MDEAIEYKQVSFYRIQYKKMNNKEAIKNFSTIQHLMWQNYHHIEDNLNSPEQISRMRKAQHEIWHVKDWLEKQIPPQPEYPEPIPIMGFQGVGGFNYFKITKNQEETEKLVSEIKMHGYYLNDGFMFLSDNKPWHSNLTYKTPWVWDGNKFHLNEWNTEFWDDFKVYLEIHKHVGLDFCTQLWMRRDYINYPFKNNVDGITDFYDVAAMPLHCRYARKVMQTYRDVYGKTYNPNVKGSPNEVAHKGNYVKYHEIMYFCEDIYEKVLKDFTTLTHLILDLTGCEGTMGELRDRHGCSRPNASNCRNGRHGKRGYDRWAVGEKHKYTRWADFPNLEKLFRANKTRRFTEDGAKTNRGTPEEQAYMMTKLAEFYKTTGRKAIFCSFPHEALKKIDGVFYPDYRVSQMKHTFDCAKAMQEAYWKVMG